MIKEIFDQPAIQQLSPSAKKIQYGQLPAITIKHPFCSALISLQGGQLLSWQPTNEQRPILWLSEKADFCPGKPIRGGLPLCWPWFSNVRTPMHGFARIEQWDLLSVEENQYDIKIQLGLRDSEATHTLWPNAFAALVTLRLGTKAYIELSYRGSFAATAALHTYFNINDVRHTTVSGLGHIYYEARTETYLKTSATSLTFTGPIDRIYTTPEATTYIHDMDRIIKVKHHNGSDVVVWNPWQEGAEKIVDMNAESYKNMLCVETARIEKPLVATPETPAMLAVTIEKM